MRYQDDPDAASRRLRVKEGAQRSTFEQRLSILERKVSELSGILNGITQQLIDVNSVVRDLQRAANDEQTLPEIEKEPIEEAPVKRKGKKTTYVIAEGEAPVKPRRQLKDDVIIADRDT
jgi:SMC interacting uncharacterized protein involved in chromosome segregation